MLESTATFPNEGAAGARRAPTVVYAGIGPALTHYDVNIENAMLVKRGTVTLPAGVQYAWPHASRRYLYVSSSNKAPKLAGTTGDTHHVTAFRIDPSSGALEPNGAPIPLRHRPIHMTTDVTSEYALIAYNDPPGVTTHKINPDGTIGGEVKQPAPLDVGIYPHQIRVTPSNTLAILAARGWGKPDDPGALKIFRYRSGMLSNGASIGGTGFGPRHLDFHPSKPWVYVSLERQHKICVFALDGDGLGRKPLFEKDTLSNPALASEWQMASTIHVHPNGLFVYGGERGTRETDGRVVYPGGENSILVYAIDQRSGEPTLIQRINTRGMHPRTFAMDSGGRVLIVANKSPVIMPDGSTLPAGLDVFRIGKDGTLDYARTYDVDTGRGALWWMGVVDL